MTRWLRGRTPGTKSRGEALRNAHLWSDQIAQMQDGGHGNIMAAMVKYDPDKHHRRSIRLQGYDYTQGGAYFVTIVTHNRAGLFDDIVLRRVVESHWRNIPRHFPNVVLDEWIVMPNHLHGIIVITDDAPSDSLGAIIGNFKSVTARRINAIRKTLGAPVWQRNYWERIVRNENGLNRIREYIINNPANWNTDEENPKNAK